MDENTSLKISPRNHGGVSEHGTFTDTDAAKSTSTVPETNILDDESSTADTENATDPLGRKALLIDYELERQGMGRYQTNIFLLCGFGYLLDLLWAQAFGLIITPMQNEFGFDDTALGHIFTSFSLGLTFGALVWGLLVDILGRSVAFNSTVLITAVFGTWLGAMSSYNGVLVLVALTGIGVGGNIPIDTTICLECLPQSRRWLLPALSAFQPLGVVVCSGMAYILVPTYSCQDGLQSCTAGSTKCCLRKDNLGWRYLLFLIGIITIAAFVLRTVMFKFEESPKYLVYRGRDHDAVRVLEYMAKYNGQECGLTLGMLEALDGEASINNLDTPSSVTGVDKKKPTMLQKIPAELERFKVLFSTFTMARLVVLVWVIYAFDYWGFTIAGAFLPTILARKGRSLGLSVDETYRSYMFIYICGIPGVLAGTLIYGHRRLALLVSSLLFGTCLFIFTLVRDEASYIGISGLEYFFQSMFNAVLYAWTPEAFPASVRGSGCGLASFWGRTFSIIAPIAGSHVLAKSLDGVLYLAAGSVWVCTVAITLLPRMSMGRNNL
ncbi:hypothetical protein PV08_08187 [Exophiala spinifera]|uniref:Major facilitator superfamily (MFS) profile domain-containing protein n=1 Tax=Exophiala spinifera TaxID=91928 RepID=A0A0D2B349_9EURO|nr:uncharacterized protein PV08_08187 [Exophiala spinifera]KIW13000.1 hypothetical protein PV08_08187 [Exophiala spinifera]